MPQSSPSMLEIIEAVRSFLEKDILTASKGRKAFDAKVAINALMIVERELSDGSGLDSAERKRLVSLLGHEGSLDDLNDELCGAISKGDIDTNSDGIMHHLQQTVMGKLQIDNPRYSTYKRLKEKGD